MNSEDRFALLLYREGKHGQRENHSPLEASRDMVSRSDGRTPGVLAAPSFRPSADVIHRGRPSA